MLREEELERVQLLGDTLDVVEAVNANNELHSREPLLQLSNTRLYRVFLQVLLDACSVGPDPVCGNTHLNKGTGFNADGECANMSQASPEFNAIGHCGQAKYTRA